MFAGNSNPALVKEMCDCLGIGQGDALVSLFSDGEIRVQINENVRGKDVFVWPDAGGVERAGAFARRWQASLAIIDKRREGPNESQVMHIIGEVAGRDALLLDDMIDTAGTIALGAQACMEHGARRVWSACTHPVLSGQALDRLNTSRLEEVVVTNTIPLNGKDRRCAKLKVLSVASLLAEAIKRIHEEESVSSLFV